MLMLKGFEKLRCRVECALAGNGIWIVTEVRVPMDVAHSVWYEEVKKSEEAVDGKDSECDELVGKVTVTFELVRRWRDQYCYGRRGPRSVKCVSSEVTIVEAYSS
jgi:hypothetical protein